MMADCHSTQERLDGWKALAKYLGRSPRTIQRWHSELGLPVRRLGGKTGSVFAFTDELDGWLREWGRNDTNALSVSDKPVSRNESTQQNNPTLRNETLNLNLISKAGENRASELVILAQEMREVVSQANLNTIVRLYREAIDLDPRNAKAFAGLSLTLIAQGLMGSLHPSAAYKPAQAALWRAMEIDPELFDVRCAEAWLKMLLQRDWSGSRDCFDKILSSCRSYSPVLGRALLYVVEGSLPDATSHILEALHHKPLSSVAVNIRCWCEYLSCRHESALMLVSQARASGHSGAILDAVDALVSVQIDEPGDRISQLSALVAASPRHYTLRGVLGYAYGMTGQTQKAWEAIEVLTEPGISGTCDYAYASALTYLGLNETRKAIESLQQSHRTDSLWSLGVKFDPILAPLRDDPHFSLLNISSLL
jgi:tetratricopeptide (TPR) repeat protein